MDIARRAWADHLKISAHHEYGGDTCCLGRPFRRLISSTENMLPSLHQHVVILQRVAAYWLPWLEVVKQDGSRGLFNSHHSSSCTSGNAIPFTSLKPTRTRLPIRIESVTCALAFTIKRNPSSISRIAMT